MGAVASTNIVTDGLIGCWDAANKRSYPGAGTTWTDLVNGNNGTLENMTAGDDEGGFNSRNGGVIEFDGTDTYIDLGSITSSNPLMCAGGPVSMCVWLYDIDGVGGDHTYPYIIQKGLGDGENGYGLIADGTGSIQVISDEAWCQTAGGIFSQDKWQFISGTIDTSGNMRAYVNGVYYPNSQRNVTAVVPDATAQMDFGKWNKFGGYLGPVYIYNTLLTDAEILQNYEATKSRFVPRITKSGLVGNWDAGDPESYPGGTTLKDTANGTAATFSNMDGSNFNSANGGYWEFDGTNEHIQCSTNSVLQPQSFSVEAWAKESTDGGELNALPIVTWKSGGSKYPAVYTSYHTAQKPIIFLSGSDYRDFDKTAVSVAGWHHVVFTYTYDDITTGAFYVDGVSIAAAITDDGTKDSTNTCIIGAIQSTYYYKGSIALVRMYDNALSAAEILDNYNKTKARFGH